MANPPFLHWQSLNTSVSRKEHRAKPDKLGEDFTLHSRMIMLSLHSVDFEINRKNSVIVRFVLYIYTKMDSDDYQSRHVPSSCAMIKKKPVSAYQGIQSF